MPLVSNDEFLQEVGNFIQQTKSSKSKVNTVYVTMKTHQVVPDSRHDATSSSSYQPPTSSSSSSADKRTPRARTDAKANKKVKHWLPKEGEPCKQVCLMHVKLGGKKFSTTVDHKSAKEFNENLSTVLRANADGLYKRHTVLEQQIAKRKAAKALKHKATMEKIAKSQSAADAKRMDTS